MAYPEQAFRLDTGAFRAARVARTTRTAAYWLTLIAIAGACAATIGFTVTRLRDATTTGPRAAPAPRPLPPAPAAAATPVAVWSVTGAASSASRMAARIGKLGYPIASTHAAAWRTRGRLVLYAPGNESAAVALARRLGLDAAVAVHPLDGVEPREIAPAGVLVLIGR